MKVLALIPARAGSKGVKNKNIREVAGEPLINYTLRSASKAKLITQLVLSTDSPKIANIGSQWDCFVLKRPAKLAGDKTSIVPVIEHALLECEKKYRENYEVILLLQPTSPIREASDIDAVIEMFENPDNDSVISVVAMSEVHPARMYKLTSDNLLLPLDEEQEQSRRQDIKPVYFRNGAIYATRTKLFRQSGKLMAGNKRAYVMPLKHLVNIDDERDLVIAGVLVELWKNGKI